MKYESSQALKSETIDDAIQKAIELNSKVDVLIKELEMLRNENKFLKDLLKSKNGKS